MQSDWSWLPMKSQLSARERSIGLGAHSSVSRTSLNLTWSPPPRTMIRLASQDLTAFLPALFNRIRRKTWGAARFEPGTRSALTTLNRTGRAIRLRFFASNVVEVARSFARLAVRSFA